MSDNIKNKIDDYLRDQLNKTEREAFEKALANDNELQMEVSFKKLAIMGAKESGRVDLKDRLKQVHKNYENENHSGIEKKSVQIWMKWAGVAASVLLIVTSGIFFLNQGDTNEKIAFNEYYQAAPLRIATRDLNTEKVILQVNELYNAEAYDKALPLFQQLLELDPANSRMRLGAGICYLELDQIDRAQEQFSYIIDAQDFRLQHQAHWYMALSFLKGGNMEGVQKHLLPIIDNSKADHYEEAVEIMEQLGNS